VVAGAGSFGDAPSCAQAAVDVVASNKASTRRPMKRDSLIETPSSLYTKYFLNSELDVNMDFNDVAGRFR